VCSSDLSGTGTIGAGHFFRDDVEQIQPGDLIWFDYNFTRRDLWDLAPRYDRGFLQDPEILPDAVPVTNHPDPPIFRTDWSVLMTSGERERRLNVRAMATGGVIGRNAYDPLRTGGGIGEGDDTETPDNDDEYIAIFPFRRFAETGLGAGYAYEYYDGFEIRDLPFPKPQFIRIRMTLHDSQLRLRHGKDFEFVVRVNPR